MADRIPFYEMFPGCRRFDGSLDALLQEAFVTSAVADREARTLELELRLTAPIPPVYVAAVEQAVAEENAFIERSKVSGHAIATGNVWIVDGSELTDNCVAGGSAKILHGSKLSGNKKIYSGIW